MKTILFTLLISSSVFAWDTVYIPGAKCGDGFPYKVFVKKGNSSKLAIELMGGGACWNLSTCWGPNFRTWIHPIPKLPAFSYLTGSESPLNDHTMLYIPYCNGDVYAGDHAANYGQLPLTNTYHYGGRNVKLTLEHLKKTKIIEFNKANSLVLFGSSAGGIGSLIHRKRIETYLKPGVKKVLIADSVGLHYGKTFWKKFTPEQMKDFRSAFEDAGVKIDVNDGMVAPQMKNYCNGAQGWSIGFIQTTRDIIMSRMFGNTSQEDHRNAVLGPSGIMNSLKDSENCSTHISDGIGHALLLIKDIAEDVEDIRTGESSRHYVDRLIMESGI